MQGNKILTFMLLSLFLMSFASAVVYKQHESVLISQPVRIDGSPSTSLIANITIKNPTNQILVEYGPMINNLTSQEHQFTIDPGLINEIGVYNYCISATDGTLNKTECFDLDVTTSGESTPLLVYVIILFFVYGLLILGIWKEDATIGMFSGLALLTAGMYILFYGVDIFKNYVTESFAFFTIGIGCYAIFSAGMKFINGE